MTIPKNADKGRARQVAIEIICPNNGEPSTIYECGQVKLIELAINQAVREALDEIEKEYGDFNDGCGCCGSGMNLKDAILSYRDKVWVE